jgi:GT2 family glycosyltransferase
MVSVIIPVHNEAKTLEDCLRSLEQQSRQHQDLEIIVVDDGSTDATPDLVRHFPQVRLLRQEQQGPAAARNNGARAARGEIILFTDGDCIPLENWLEEMLQPLQQLPDLVGVKGAYVTRQKSLTARFVQLEYEDKYDRMAKFPFIDFIDTYSAGYRRENFMAVGGFDQEFPVACAEDVELSFRLAGLGYKMVFNPMARVIHRHPEKLWVYLGKKFKFAYWRILSLKKNPQKIIADTHTPQTMKLQLLLFPAGIASLLTAPFSPALMKFFAAVFLGVLATTIPFVIKAMGRDALVGFLAPFFLILRSAAQFLGVSCGIFSNVLSRRT